MGTHQTSNAGGLIWREHVDGMLAWLWGQVAGGGGGGGGGIVPWTADILPAASPFTPLASQGKVAVNTAGGVVVVKTPLSPTGGRPFDGQIFYVKARVASATPITIQANAATPGGCTVEDPSNGGTYGAAGSIQAVAGACIGFEFRDSDGLWIAFSGM